MTTPPREIVIVGDGEFAEIAYEYFTHDSPYDVVAFAVESAYREQDELFALPVVDFEDVESRYDPERYGAFVAITYTRLNRVRKRLLAETRGKGYRPVSYVSSRAFVWHDVELGDNCFVFENNVVQYRVRVGENVVLWSGNHVGHRTVIGDDCFVSSHVVISGYCKIGARSFLGVNSSFADFVEVGEDTIVGAGAVVPKNLERGRVWVGNPARALDKTSFEAFAVPEEER